MLKSKIILKTVKYRILQYTNHYINTSLVYILRRHTLVSNDLKTNFVITWLNLFKKSKLQNNTLRNDT